jgi:hypothetical protein
VASTDYSGLALEGLDAILEVGIASHLHDERGRLLNLGIMVRLVDPATKQVLGRRSPWPQFPRPFDPEPAEEQARAWGREKVTQCLKELGLIAE